MLAGLAGAAPLELSPAERAWATAHPVVQVGLFSDFAPFYAFEDSSAAIPQGFVSELLALWSERTGLRFEFRRYGNLDDVMTALRDGVEAPFFRVGHGVFATNGRSKNNWIAAYAILAYLQLQIANREVSSWRCHHRAPPP